jgi:hypothetical protein
MFEKILTAAIAGALLNAAEVLAKRWRGMK